MSRNNSCITFPRNMDLPPRLPGIDSVMISNNQNSIDDCTEAFTNMSLTNRVIEVSKLFYFEKKSTFSKFHFFKFS